MSKAKPTCQDCYFHRNALCALALERPCPTFRAAIGTLAPPPKSVPSTAVTPSARSRTSFALVPSGSSSQTK